MANSAGGEHAGSPPLRHNVAQATDLSVRHINMPLNEKAVTRLEHFAAEAGVSVEDVCRFAVSQFLAWQDGVALLIMRGQHHNRPLAD